ncbi:MaoC family dehydratase N-terminal domain-containing protein [Streptosporangium sp. NBC_01755]|uniref:FAS1-like dehydratase domain-containing protein n=1 Tax=unclassified Streptosporangium TaxID=2632669 RepID=UPI002DD9D799|nr:MULTISPECIES: MaoC family dehydratase N-terminal domain-containing protein [unclassified Streptosporangium]WSA24731.1 MaoC family dehydratase N-terminal domain-containing protein [Streptosporangium sp. NBC_01810]WSC97193.1 MaoC family dehydratase N-terminal domain-containing protein [Streptosporangium sp. NBC_01755]
MDVEDVSSRLLAAAAPHLNNPGPRRWSPRPIEVSAVWNFCEAVEDGNPVYWDHERATSSRFGRMIAPPQALWALSMRNWWLPEYFRDRDDLVGLGNDSIPSMIARQIVQDFGFNTATNVTRSEEYLEPFGPGDGRLGQSETLVGLSGVKRTRVGMGVFLNTEIEFVTEKDDRLVARAHNTLLMYQPFAAEEA